MYQMVAGGGGGGGYSIRGGISNICHRRAACNLPELDDTYDDS